MLRQLSVFWQLWRSIKIKTHVHLVKQQQLVLFYLAGGYLRLNNRLVCIFKLNQRPKEHLHKRNKKELATQRRYKGKNNSNTHTHKGTACFVMLLICTQKINLSRESLPQNYLTKETREKRNDKGIKQQKKWAGVCGWGSNTLYTPDQMECSAVFCGHDCNCVKIVNDQWYSLQQPPYLAQLFSHMGHRCADLVEEISSMGPKSLKVSMAQTDSSWSSTCICLSFSPLRYGWQYLGVGLIIFCCSFYIDLISLQVQLKHYSCIFSLFFYHYNNDFCFYMPSNLSLV